MREALVIILMLSAIATWGQKTTRRGIKPIEPIEQPKKKQIDANLFDTISCPDSSVVALRGYDKPLRSRRETFFAINNSSDRIGRISFTISYYDMNGRMLHRQSRNIAADIPPGETRQINFKSWDLQNIFYYSGSAQPKTENASPYTIKIEIDTIFNYCPKPINP